jgi:hypothetical protein
MGGGGEGGQESLKGNRNNMDKKLIHGVKTTDGHKNERGQMSNGKPRSIRHKPNKSKPEIE